MLLKLIDCQLSDSTREAFSNAQKAWADLRGIDGFRGQLGGWSREPGESDRAIIVGFWLNAERYDEFMATHHDRIAEAPRQRETYDADASSVTLWRPIATDSPEESPLGSRLTSIQEFWFAWRALPHRHSEFIDAGLSLQGGVREDFPQLVRVLPGRAAFSAELHPPLLGSRPDRQALRIHFWDAPYGAALRPVEGWTRVAVDPEWTVEPA
ncbi:MAG: DUF4937 domain-containing protein [Phycisphaerales bacterium]